MVLEESGCVPPAFPVKDPWEAHVQGIRHTPPFYGTGRGGQMVE